MLRLGIVEEQRQLLQGLNDRSERTEKAVGDLQKRQADDSARITRLEEQMKNGPPSIGGASTRSGANSKDFSATYVEAYGWVEDWSSAEARNQTSISDRNAYQLVTNMLAVLERKDPPLRAKVDEIASSRAQGSKPTYASVKVKFVAGAESDELWCAKKIWENAWNDASQKPQMVDSMVGYGPNFLQRVKFRVESAPWKTPHLQAIGRFHGVWGREASLRLIQLKGTAGSGSTPSEMWTSPADNGNRTQLGEFCAGGPYGGSGQWRILKTNWDAFAAHHRLGLTSEALEGKLATNTHR